MTGLAGQPSNEGFALFHGSFLLWIEGFENRLRTDRKFNRNFNVTLTTFVQRWQHCLADLSALLINMISSN